MQAFECVARLDKRGRIELPQKLAKRIPAQTPLRVIVLIDAGDAEERAWDRAVQSQFFEGYAREDALYDTHA